jgi:2-dehydro-3-deoxyphosphooctonate aldolase (KDO 8-P synthase)
MVLVGEEGESRVQIGEGRPLALISGPCVVESEEVMFTAARRLVEISQEVGAPLIFKSSYEKDNRTSATAYRGPGLEQGLELLRRLRGSFAFPLLSDVHRAADARAAAEVLDLLQVPAFLCRQTSLLEAVGSCGRPVNIKKGQFLAPGAIAGAVDKVRQAGCDRVLLTERGSCFGYDQLVCDMTSIAAMRALGCPVIIDAGHAANRRDQIPLLARCGVAAGADALYIESHPEPASARCDSKRMLSLEELRRLLLELAPLARWG